MVWPEMKVVSDRHRGSGTLTLIGTCAVVLCVACGSHSAAHVRTAPAPFWRTGCGGGWVGNGRSTAPVVRRAEVAACRLLASAGVHVAIAKTSREASAMLTASPVRCSPRPVAVMETPASSDEGWAIVEILPRLAATRGCYSAWVRWSNALNHASEVGGDLPPFGGYQNGQGCVECLVWAYVAIAGSPPSSPTPKARILWARGTRLRQLARVTWPPGFSAACVQD